MHQQCYEDITEVALVVKSQCLLSLYRPPISSELMWRT